MRSVCKKSFLRNALFLSLLFCLMLGAGARAAGWEKDAHGVRYLISGSAGYARGWMQISKRWFYFDENGYRKTGWLQVDGKRYALKPSNGVRISGTWFRVGKNYYYADKNGVLQKNAWIDDCYLKSNYRRAAGWLKLGNYKYYLNPVTGKKVVGMTRIDGKFYFLNGGGRLITNKWKKLDGNYYYFKADGTMATDEWVGAYYVDSSGVKTDKTRVKGLVLRGGKYYYLNDSYNRVTGWVTVGGNKYYFGSDGAAYTGARTIGGNQYYFDENGVMATGWKTVKGNEYYFDADGAMVKGCSITLDGVVYKFNKKGIWTNTSRGRKIVKYAMQFLGNPYVYGGNSLTSGVDCSGFTQQVMKYFGISIPRTADEQRLGTSSWGTYTKSREIEPTTDTLLPGDLIFYGSSPNYAGHVALYIGNGKIIHASNETTGIIISPYSYGSPIIGARRYW